MGNELTPEQEASLIRFFTQCPNIILYGLPDVAIMDKWALLTLVGMCWDRTRGNKTLKEREGPYKLSLREISAITGVKHNALRSTDGKDPRQGVLDRLQAMKYVSVIDGKPVNDVTGQEGRKQTYLYIHLEKIWIDNAKYMEEGSMPPYRLVSPDSFKVIAGFNVHDVNIKGNEVNSDVHVGNDIGNEVNDTVHDASEDLAQRNSKTSNTFNKREDANNQQHQEQKEASPSLSDKKVADEEVKRRITAFIAIVTTLRRKAFNDEGLDAGIPNEKTMSLLTEMLTKREIPREEQERVFQAYWEHVDENGIHWWRDPNKLTINSYVKNYASRLTSLNNPQQQPSRKGKGAQTTVQPLSTEQQQQEKQGNLTALVRAIKSNLQVLKSQPGLLVTYPALKEMLEQEGVAIPC